MEEKYDNLIQMRVAEVFHIMEQRVTAEEMKQIHAAYELAYDAHKEQKRKSGEPYIIHPIAVARIVADELKLGANPVMAAFLHDVVEDTLYTIDDIKERFGDDVAFLVGVVTKRKKEHYIMSKQLDNFKQMLDSFHYDIRAILLKLADRLHNMRTLDSMRPDKQMKIAGETDYFYAPLANRLGLYRIKTELENLSMRYRCPHDYEYLVDLLRNDRERNKASLDFFTHKLKDILMTHGYDVRVEVNYRMPYSLWRKMKKHNKDFNHLENRHFVNIIFPDDLMMSEKNTCLQIYSILTEHNNFEEKPGGISNYIDHPKENGYQSFHVHLLNDHGKWEEVHICSERMVRNSSLGCVAERTEDNLRNWIENFRSVLQDIARNCREDDYIDSVVSSFYNDDITVYTPKGSPIVLPQRATADKYDVERDDASKRADLRCETSLENALRNTVTGYETVTLENKNIQVAPKAAHYAMLPVWLLSTRWRDQNYLFAINGQTGKLVGDLPADKGKLHGIFWGIFLGLGTVLSLLFAGPLGAWIMG